MVGSCDRLALILTFLAAGTGYVLNSDHFPFFKHNWILPYLASLLLGSIILTFLALRRLLTHSDPLRLDRVPWLRAKLPHLPVPTRHSFDVDALVDDVEKRFVRNWYCYISADAKFVNETRLALNGVVRKFARELAAKFGSKKFAHGLLLIYLRHIREYRKAAAKVERSGNGTVEEVYRYGHRSSKAAAPKSVRDHVHQVTANVLHKYLDPELWNSLPCHTVVSIFARKVTMYGLTYAASPGYLNASILKWFGGSKAHDCDFTYVSLSDVGTGGDVPTFPAPKPPDAVDEADTDTIDSSPVNIPETFDSDRPERGPAPSTEPVKIYEARSANSTWRNSSDLECISVGEDLLAFQNASEPFSQVEELIGHKLWNDNSDFHPAKPANKANSIEEQIVKHAPSSAKHLSNVSATLHNMKELQQSTVNNVVKPVSQATSNAIHKIGDLQDEAAGMVEGILDFGMAGLRKGLRLTGLQDNINEFTAKAQKLRNVPETSPRLSKTHSSTDSDGSGGSAWINPLAVGESPSFDGNILLESGPRSIPKIREETIESPDLEYEEPADFASTIAKLRSLLQQKTTESACNTPAVSPLPTEGVGSKLVSPAELDVSKVDGGKSSLFKLAGVFQNTLNTIKTALPGNAQDPNLAGQAESWTYIGVEPKADDFSHRLKQLIAERDFSYSVDTAYEALDSSEPVVERAPTSWQRNEDDENDYEFEGLESRVPLSRVALDICVELVRDTSPMLTHESLFNATLLIFGNFTEEAITNCLDVRNFVTGKLPELGNDKVIAMKLEELVEECLRGYSDSRYLRDGLKLFVSSLQSQKINEDLFLQVLDLFAAQLI